jgi:thiol-disulfide isomerase/thioredoxin
MNRTPRLVLAALAAALVAALGIYGFRTPESKIEPGPAASGGIQSLKPFATGTLAGLLIKDDRPALADAAFQDGKGNALQLSRWKGRVVLVNLWATWCAPCRKEMPALAELQKRLGSNDFEVVAISLDLKGVAASSAFLKDTGADSLALYVDPDGKLLNELMAPGLPATILVDRQGREAARMVGPAEWSSPEAVALIKAALAEKPPQG